jgi:hypothetical protein
MKKYTLATFMILALTGVPLLGQKIDTQAPGPATITRVETALNHLTVIELSEPVMSVATGSQSFKVEWRENKVFIEPTEPNLSTNLFIWTKSGRLNYELEPAGEVTQMDFAIDQPPTPKTISKTPVVKVDPPSPPVVSESVFLKGTPVRTKTYKTGKNRVQVMFKDIFNQDGRLYVRYVVENSTKRVYDLRPPQVFMVELPRGPKTLLEQHNLQLTDSQAGKIVGARQVPLELLLQESQSVQVKPGDETVGIIEIKVPSAGQRATVLRLVLPDSSQRPIMATLLL